jgi:hypothetical protein
MKLMHVSGVNWGKRTKDIRSPEIHTISYDRKLDCQIWAISGMSASTAGERSNAIIGIVESKGRDQGLSSACNKN